MKAEVYNKISRISILILGIALIIIGAAGLVLPLIPGILLIFLGLVLLLPYLPEKLKKNKFFRKMMKFQKKFAGIKLSL